jgi:hypothetical protein
VIEEVKLSGLRSWRRRIPLRFEMDWEEDPADEKFLIVM